MKLIYFPFFLLFITMQAQAQNALNFDGLNDYVQAPQPGPIGNTSRTVEAWVKIASTSASQKVILDWGDMAIGHRFTFNLINATPRIEVGGAGINAASALSTNVWHHVAASYNNTNSVFSIYVDGVLSNSDTLSVAVNTSNVNGIIIGRRNDAINNFEGLIDEVRVWNLVRSQSQIAAARNSEFCSTVPGLVAYYKFNQGIAAGANTGLTSLLDLSGSNNNGVLNGFTLTGTNSNWVIGNLLNSNATSSANPNVCGSSYISPSGNLYTVSGIYNDTIPNAVGCDSVITINLTLNNIDTGVTVNANSLAAQQLGASYQWVNCAVNFAAIGGQTLATFSPTISGTYAVIISNGQCADTSVCISFNVSGINESGITIQPHVAPNPTLNFTTITAPAFTKSTLTLFDLMGNEIMHQAFNISAKIDLSQLSNGIYIAVIRDKDALSGKSATCKLIKE